jgi:hypothetical protein
MMEKRSVITQKAQKADFISTRPDKVGVPTKFSHYFFMTMWLVCWNKLKDPTIFYDLNFIDVRLSSSKLHKNEITSFSGLFAGRQKSIPAANHRKVCNKNFIY